MAKYYGRSTIGLRDVCYAVLTETETGHSYGEVIQVAGAIDATIAPNSEASRQYADDGDYENYVSLGDISLTLEMAGLPTQVQVDWFGYRVDANGALIRDRDAQGKDVALGFRSLNSDGVTFKYVWVYRAKASMPEEKAHTKEGNTITYTTQSVTLNASPRKDDGKWQVVLNELDSGTNAAALATFLDSVYEEADVVGP